MIHFLVIYFTIWNWILQEQIESWGRYVRVLPWIFAIALLSFAIEMTKQYKKGQK
jgi:hypothetical protein